METQINGYIVIKYRTLNIKRANLSQFFEL